MIEQSHFESNAPSAPLPSFTMEPELEPDTPSSANPQEENALEADTPKSTDASNSLIPDQPVRHRRAVKTRKLVVAKWKRTAEAQAQFPNVDAFLVRYAGEKGRLGMIRKAWFREDAVGSVPIVEELMKLGVEISPKDVVRGASGFVEGKPLHEDLTATIRTCGGRNRPPFVFRVTHDGTADGKIKPMPHGGLKARGYGLLKTDPVHFQEMVQLHLNWKSRFKSPFISVAVNIELALIFCEMYQYRKCQGIKIHIIRTKGLCWNHDEQRMWRVNRLVEHFGLMHRLVYHAECLIENYIPEEAIVRTYSDMNKIPRYWKRYMGAFSDRMFWRRQGEEVEKKARALMREQNKGVT